MRVLFGVFPGVGHFHPLVPIAKALEEAGHEVAFSSAVSFASHVEQSGLPFFPVGMEHAALFEALPILKELTGEAFEAFVRTQVFPGVCAARMLPDLLDVADRWLPDLMVWDNCAFAVPVVAEHRGIPHASVKTVNWYNAYPHRFAIAAPLEMLRASVRLPPDPACAMQFRYLHFVCEPPQFQPAGESPPPTMHRLRRVIFDQSGDETLPAWVAALPARPTLYATLGTIYIRKPVLAAMVEALRDEPLNVILTVGHTVDPEEFGPQPENVHIERYIPQSLLLPRCDLVLSHAGSGTIMAALDAGLPMVSVPIGADQPENAARCVELGVGITIPPGTRTPEVIRAAVRTVLATPAYRANAQRVRDEMAAMPGPEEAVALLERLAVEKRPISAG